MTVIWFAKVAARPSLILAPAWLPDPPKKLKKLIMPLAPLSSLSLGRPSSTARKSQRCPTFLLDWLVKFTSSLPWIMCYKSPKRVSPNACPGFWVWIPLTAFGFLGTSSWGHTMQNSMLEMLGSDWLKQLIDYTAPQALNICVDSKSIIYRNTISIK